MRSTFLITLASLSLVAAAPAATSTAAASTTSAAGSCESKCTDYNTWMTSCAGYDPSGSGWPSACTDFCTSSSKQKSYASCQSCMSVSDNGSRERLCAQLKTLGKIPNNTKTNSDDEKDEKDKNAASPSTTSLGVGVIALVAAAVMLF